MMRGTLISVLLATAVVTVRAGEPAGSDTRATCYPEFICASPDSPVKTIRECCVDDPIGLAYNIPGTEPCVPCVVFGWLNVSERRSEQGPGHSLMVGYRKAGSLPINNEIEFNVVDVEGTARRGSNLDYTLNTDRIIISPAMEASVVITLRVDGVALEEEETIQLRLQPDNPIPPSDGVFCIEETTLTVLDSDTVEIQLTEDDYRGGEQDLNIDITVMKNTPIATPLTLTISPVTLQEARDRGQFPEGIELPDDQMGFSPIDANSNDFDDTIKTITFEADEGSTPIVDKSIEVPIVDDDINEANEQDFVVIINVTNTINPPLTIVTRRSSILRIIDNDPIRIGFEMERNVFPEPEFDTFTEVFLAKEDGVVSEQRFRVALEITPSAPTGSGFDPAMDGMDYTGFSDRPVIDFAPDVQQAPVGFTLLHDDVPESTEAFQISSAPSENFPNFLSPRNLFPQTFVVIDDDDIIVRIGFENTSYVVDEEIGMQEVCVRVFAPDDMTELPPGDILVLVGTVPGTADETDYTPLNPVALDVLLFFNDATRRECFDVEIINDVLVEGQEQFSLELLEESPPPIVTVFFPNVSNITITDQDEAVIGFIETNYTALESDGFVTLVFGVLEGGVQEGVEVRLTLSSGSAGAGADYIDISDVFTFDRTTTRIEYNVTLIDDDIFEFDEEFNAQLSFVSAVDRVSIDPAFADIEIVDDDVVVFGFDPDSYSEPESVGTVDIGVSFLTGSFGTASISVQLSLETSDGTAQGSPPEADYVPVQRSIQFSQPGTTQQVSVTINDDSFTEGTETFEASLSVLMVLVDGTERSLTPSESDRIRIQPETASVEILDNDETVIGFLREAYTAFENEGVISFEIGVISGQLRIDVPFNFSTGDVADPDSAEAGLDYTAVLNRGIAFNALTTTANVPVEIFDDDLLEDTERFNGLLSATILPSNVRIDPETAVGVILEETAVTVGWEFDMYNTSEDSGVVELCAIILNPTGELPDFIGDFFLNVSYLEPVVSPASINGDFLPTPTSVGPLGNNSRRSCINVPIIDNMIPEPVESFIAVLSSGQNAPMNLFFNPESTTVQIADNDVIVIGWEQLRYTTPENNGSVQLCARISSPTDSVGIELAPFLLDVQYSDISAVQNNDYVIPSTSLEIGPFSGNSRRACVDVDIIDDSIAENVESFTATLVARPSSPPLLMIDPADTTVDIEDNDVIVVGWERLTYDTSENDDMVQLCAVITSPSEIDRDPFTLVVSCTPGSAVTGEDYQPCPSSIGPFDISQDPPRACIMVDINDDEIPEDPENFNAVLESPSDPLLSVDPTRDETVVTIFDNDVIEVTLDPTPTVSVTETETSVEICVQISSPPDSVEIQRGPFFVSLSTMDGTATDPADYVGVDIMEFGPFSNTMRRRCVNIPIVLDSIPEDDETFKVNADENVDGVVITGPMTTVTIIDSIRRVNDTVIGDPLMTVPLNLLNTSVIPKLGENSILNLCYEVHGEPDANFNLVSDGCVSVNAHYTQVRPTETQNIIDAINVRAVDNAGTCRNIAVNLAGCAASVDGVDVTRFMQQGVSVRQYTNRVRIAVPNCQDLDLVMWVFCESRTFWSSQLDSGGQEITFDAEMIRFVIARGFNLQETSHGILGQFWNIPITVSPIEGPDPSQEHYSITVQYPGGNQRSFVGMLWPLTWEYREEYCLYSGNGQAGPLDEPDAVGGPNDPVIEGDYFQYKVDSDFATEFEFAHFNETMCIA